MNWEQLVDRWISLESLTPVQLSLVSVGSFLAISLVFYLTGKLILGIGRNKLPGEEAVGSRRPLVLGRLTEALAMIVPVSKAKQEGLRKELMQAGFYHRKAVEEFLGLRNAALLFWLVFVGAAMVAVADPAENLTPKILLGGLVILVLVYGLPRITLNALANARCQRIQHALPDALDMITMTVTGGLPLRQAFQRVSKEMHGTHPDVACELAIIDLQSETGSLELALKQFARRIEIPDVAALATMVHHAEKLGGQVANAFREFADGIRRTRRQLAEERGNKSSIKLLFPIVFLLAPPIYILLLGPAVIELKNFARRESLPGGVLSQGAAGGGFRTIAPLPTTPGANTDVAAGTPAPTPTPALPSVLRTGR